VFAQALVEGRTMTAEQALAWQPAIPPQQAHLSTHASPTASTRPASSPAGLTTREVEVLRLVAQGLTDVQVAQRLVISPRTVTTHLSSIYNKLGINSRAAAVRFAAEHQLL
jgi:DNA-binding NarL/FixJ family response regulator